MRPLTFPLLCWPCPHGRPFFRILLTLSLWSHLPFIVLALPSWSPFLSYFVDLEFDYCYCYYFLFCVGLSIVVTPSLHVVLALLSWLSSSLPGGPFFLSCYLDLTTMVVLSSFHVILTLQPWWSFLPFMFS